VPKVYLETTIPSYLAGRPSRDLLVAGRQQITRDWWEFRKPAFDLYVSQAVIDESAAGDPVVSKRRLELLVNIPVLAMNDGIMELAEKLILGGPIPVRAAADAVHIAFATSYQCDYLLTWNCTHIANAEIQRRIRRVVAELGFELPVICTPEEFMGDDDALPR
jgi:hypothetical protein